MHPAFSVILFTTAVRRRLRPARAWIGGCSLPAAPAAALAARLALALGAAAGHRRPAALRRCIWASRSAPGAPSASGAAPGCRARASALATCFLPACSRSAGRPAVGRRTRGRPPAALLAAAAAAAGDDRLHRDDLRLAEAGPGLVASAGAAGLPGVRAVQRRAAAAGDAASAASRRGFHNSPALVGARAALAAAALKWLAWRHVDTVAPPVSRNARSGCRTRGRCMCSSGRTPKPTTC